MVSDAEAGDPVDKALVDGTRADDDPEDTVVDTAPGDEGPAARDVL